MTAKEIADFILPIAQGASSFEIKVLERKQKALIELIEQNFIPKLQPLDATVHTMD